MERSLAKRMNIFTNYPMKRDELVMGIMKIGLKSICELVRLKRFNKFGYQQLQIDTAFLCSILFEVLKVNDEQGYILYIYIYSICIYDLYIYLD